MQIKSTPPVSESTLGFLDGVRGLTAVYVMLFHILCNRMVWEGFWGYLTHPQLYSLPGSIFAYVSLIFSYGHEAVLLFFILSGFVIHLRYARQTQTVPRVRDRLDVGNFLWRRLKRIYPPLLWALTLTFILDNTTLLVTPARDHISAVSTVTPYAPLLPRLITTLLLIPNPTPEWGSNLALWSLRLEWWFYLLYPAVWWISRRSLRAMTAILAVLFAASLLPVATLTAGSAYSWPLRIAATIFSYIGVWWLGALLAELYVGRLRISFHKLIPLLTLLPPLLIAEFMDVPLFDTYPAIQVVLWGLALTGLFAALFAWQRRGGSLHWLERLKPLGDMSYTLYITHGPILVWLSVLILERTRDGVLPTTYEWVIPGIVLCMGSAWLTHFVVERPFTRRPQPANVSLT